MKPASLFVYVSAALSAAALSTAWLACGSTDFSKPIDGGVTDDGASSSDANVVDAASFDAGPEGAPAPGIFQCEGSPTIFCAAGKQVCCLRDQQTNYCQPAGAPCIPDAGGAITVECDDDTDCPSSKVCCALPSGSTFAGVFCQPTCAAPNVHMCSVQHPECPDGGQCNASPVATFLRACQ